jgi:hypothetical protein
MNQPPSGRVIARPNVAGAQAQPQAINDFGQVDIGGRLLTVTDQMITFGNQQLKPSDITGVRFGVYKRYVNGIRVEQSHCIWLTNGHTQMQIECAVGMFVLGTTVESRYQQALKALWQPVMVGLMGVFIEALHEGAGFSVGDITFNKSGLHRAGSIGPVQRGVFKLLHSVAGGQTPEERENARLHLAWEEYGGHNSGDGNVYLHRKNRGVWAQFALRDVWNAVCLDPLLSYLYEDGRLWTVIGR